MKPSFFSCFWHPEKNRVDFTGYPSNHFQGCSLNWRVSSLLLYYTLLQKSDTLLGSEFEWPRWGVTSDGNFIWYFIRRCGYGWLFLFPVSGNGNNPIYPLLFTFIHLNKHLDRARGPLWISFIKDYTQFQHNADLISTVSTCALIWIALSRFN